VNQACFEAEDGALKAKFGSESITLGAKTQAGCALVRLQAAFQCDNTAEKDMIYQFNSEMLPDTCFQTGSLKYIVPGNEGRLLDGRRTPVRLLEVKHISGFFVVEILDFEDKGACWEIPLERIDRFQFAKESAEAGKGDIEFYREIISRLDQPLNIPADKLRRKTTESEISSLRKRIKDWLNTESDLFASGASINSLDRIRKSALWHDLEHYMTAQNLWALEKAFATQYVSNPNSGELIKGHRIVLAELGLVAFEGKQVREPDLFGGAWSKERRADHILHRLAFVRELFEQLGQSSVVLYRGFSAEGQPETQKNNSFISSTFSLDVAMSHFTGRDPTNTGVLLRQSVPVERIFMTFLETVQMNRQFKEAEAILLYDEGNKVF
jgi:hypothetical protein